MRQLSNNVTDRAKRYRAQSRVTGPRRCVICGSRQNLGVMHLSGNEDDGEPANLAYGCKSCNGKLAAAFKAVGAGRPTRQYNPASGQVPTFEQYAWAVSQQNHSGEHGQAGAIIHATPKHKRIEYAKRIARKAVATKRERFEDRWNPASFRKGQTVRYDVSDQPYWTTRGVRSRVGKVVDADRRGIVVNFQDGKLPHENGEEYFEYGESRLASLRANPLFSRAGRGARQTTPASGGIAKFSQGRKPVASSSKKKSAPAAAYSRVPDDATIQEGFRRGLSLAEILRQNPSLDAVRAMDQYGRAAGAASSSSATSVIDREFKSALQGFGKVSAEDRKQLRGVFFRGFRSTVKNPTGFPQGKWYNFRFAAHYDNGFKVGEHLPGKPKAATLDKLTAQYLRTNAVSTNESPDYIRAEFVRGVMAGFDRLEQKRTLNPAKFDRCVKEVKARGGDVNAYAVCTAAGTRKRKNPAAASAEVFEEFHGYQPSEIIEVTKRIHYHEHLAAAGKLTHLEVAGIDRRRHKITGFRGSILAFNEDKNQLFVEGGDQSINLGDFGIRQPHELETLGKLTDIGYHTNKTHLGDEGGEAVYVHKLRTTNDNGRHVVVNIARYPDVIYDVRNEQLMFSGGSYEILREGINK